MNFPRSTSAAIEPVKQTYLELEPQINKPINTFVKEVKLNPSLPKEEMGAILQLMVMRWLAINICWLAGAVIWTYFPFFQQQIGDQARTWIWNFSFIWCFGGLLWEGFWAFIDREKYFNSNPQSVKAIKALFNIVQNIVSRKPWLSEFNEESKQSFLFFAVRGFYLPLMIHFSLDHTSILQLPQDWNDLKLKITSFAWLQDWIYFLDVLPFAAAYLINYGEFRTRSVNSKLVGWFFCLACYPPFNDAWGRVFAYSHEEFGGWWGWMSLALIAVYTWSSLALGLRAGHLQYRGLCQTGPYAFVRHPAYAFKNLAWLIGSIAWMAGQISVSASKDVPALILWNVVGCAFWIWVYHMRAVTEEEHLLHYPEYQAYCKKVKYRYIPYVI